MRHTTSLFTKGQLVTLSTQGYAIPGHDARKWSVAQGKIVEVCPSVRQYAYHVELTTRAPGTVVHFVSAHDLRPQI